MEQQVVVKGERDMVRAMRQAKEELGTRFSRDNFRTLMGNQAEYAIRKRFGTWNAAVNRFEMEHPEYVINKKRQMVLYLYKAQMILGSSFKRDYYRLLKGFPPECQIVLAFGSWSKAVEEMQKELGS